MRKIIFLLFIVSVSILGNSFPIMMEIKSDEKIPKDFRFGVAEGLTTIGYSLIDSKTQEEALKEQSEQRKKGCYDDECLVDTGKMLAARGLVVVEVEKRDKLFTFSVRYVDFETGVLTKTLTRYYKDSLNDYEKLNDFGKNLSLELFGKISDKKEVIREVVIKEKSRDVEKIDDKEEIKTVKKEDKIVEKFRVEFVTIPSGVEVYDSDNNLLGETPFFVKLPKGAYKFSFEKKGYQEIKKDFLIKESEKIELKLDEKIYILKVDANISDAKVYIDNKERGVTPLSIKLKEGIYSIKVEKEEYDSYSEEIPLKKDLEKNIVLNKNIFELKVESNVEGGKVYINGEVKGKTPYKTKLSKGKHKIKITQENYNENEKEFVINKDETIMIKVYKKGNAENEMVIIPSGKFMFGFKRNDYSKTKEVAIKTFLMDKYEVSYEKFKHCVDSGNCILKNYSVGGSCNYGNNTKNNHPINCVNWYAANEYCKWEGKRLPTEEEWKYAAKGGNVFDFSGSDNPFEVAWFKGNSARETKVIGTKKPNGYGLYDMSGNVSEWTMNYYIYGGNYNNYKENLYIYLNDTESPNIWSSYYGFRCVKDIKKE